MDTMTTGPQGDIGVAKHRRDIETLRVS